MVSRSYAWLALNGGAWSLAANWDDLTDGIDPSLTIPGAQDSVAITGATGDVATVVTGAGSAANAAFLGDVALNGAFTFGAFTLGAGNGGGLLATAAGATIAAATATIASGSLLVSGAGAHVSVSGTLTLGGAQSGTVTCGLDATSGGRVQIASLLLDAGSASLAVDADSIIEIGTQGGALAGTLTIDPGAALAGQGDANAYGNVLNDGTITAEAGVLLLGATAGQGVLAIAAGSSLVLNGATGAGESVVFAGPQATLALATEFDGPQGSVAGFAPGDAIDMLGDPISAATYMAGAPGTGVLTLFYGDQAATSFTLLGDYASSVFLTAPDGAGGTLITVAPAASGGGTASAGTATPDQYLWTAAAGGNWNSAANWRDVTTGAAPAAIAPGQHDSVTIAAPGAGSFAVIAGPANAASLTLTGDIALAGQFAIGALTVGSAAAAAAFDLLPAGTMTAASLALANGSVALSGGALLAVAGTITLGGGAAGIGLPVTALSATAGGTITAAGLTLGGGAGNTVTTDPTGIIAIGGAGPATAGAVTIQAGATLSGNGAVNPFGAIVDNGTITANGGTLSLGAVTGTGSLTIAAGATLLLQAATALPVGLTGAGAILAVADELTAFTGTLTGFVPGDAIDVQNDPITGFAQARTGGITTITLYYGSTAVSRFALSGAFAGDHFFLVPDAAGGTELLLAQGNGGGGGGGQGTTDLLSWAQPGSGAWSHAANWFDLTTGAAATAPPGTLNPVQITGPAGTSFQTIGGPAVCASLACFGNTILSGAFTTGTLSIGGTPYGSTTLTAGTLDVGTDTSLTATQAAIADGALLVAGPAATLTLSGTLTLGGGAPTAQGPSALLAASGGAVIQLAGLALGGGSADALTTDIASSIEIGTLGGAALGAITIDPGIAVAGNGQIATGAAIIDNGTLTAQGGTLATGAVSGAGTLAIGAVATLALTAAESCPIQMQGAGAALLLEGVPDSLSAPISGFSQGDLILCAAGPVGGASFTPGAAGVGTLTLTEAGQTIGTLLLAGNFAGDSFAVQPDGSLWAITVQTAQGGPPAGTTTPDDYAWIGGTSGVWSAAANWADLSAGQSPAALAPGANDIVAIAGGVSAFTTITGPADAASLALSGEVALTGTYATASLAIGEQPGQGTGELALGAGGAVQAAQAAITGGILAHGGNLLVTGTLTLQSGAIAASAQANLDAATLLLDGAGDAISVDATSRLEIGTAGGAAQGDITIDPGAVLAGAGVLTTAGQIIDQGTITALANSQAGTLALGAVTGTGTLLIGPGATMLLEGAAATGLLVDFAGPGTLSVAGPVPLAAIAGFGDGDVIALPITGVTTAIYAVTAPNTGVLTLDDGDQPVASLTLIGAGKGQGFSVAAAGGETLITTETNDTGGGGSTMRGGQQASGSGTIGLISSFAFFAGLPLPAQIALADFEANAGGESYVYDSPDGTAFGGYYPAYANVAVVSDPVAYTSIALPPGYDALLAQGNVPIHLTDGAGTGVLLVGNAANDTIVGNGPNDTLVGGAGGNSVLWASKSETLIGGGNDTIITSTGPCAITTAAACRSVVFTGVASNTVTLSGMDTLVAASGPDANDTVTALGAATIFTPAIGQLTFNGGDAADTVVGFGSTVLMTGGTGNGSVLWCGAADYSEYFGGAGAAVIVGDAGYLSVQGGAGAITVFAGSGTTVIDGAPGPSQFITGLGASTVTAASGNLVWLVGAANDSLIASGGNATIWGANSSGNDIFQAGPGPCTLSGGAGNDTFSGGAGTALILAGSGADAFSFTRGLAGGDVTIYGFATGADQIDLHGYAGFTDTVEGGNAMLSLADGTTITLNGVGSLAGIVVNQA
jgi:filamentous hemagglutinin